MADFKELLRSYSGRICKQDILNLQKYITRVLAKAAKKIGIKSGSFEYNKSYQDIESAICLELQKACENWPSSTIAVLIDHENVEESAEQFDFLKPLRFLPIEERLTIHGWRPGTNPELETRTKRFKGGRVVQIQYRRPENELTILYYSEGKGTRCLARYYAPNRPNAVRLMYDLAFAFDLKYS